MIPADWKQEIGRFPPAPVVGGPRLIRKANEARGRRLLVLDDDPTGSQSVHGVEVVMMGATTPSDNAEEEREEILRALRDPGSTCFVLTNSRSLPESRAAALAHHFGRLSVEIESRLGGPVAVVSRSDSTLRGHLITEVRALDEGRREADGHG